MTTPHDPESVIAAWLEEGPTELPESNRRAIATATQTITQRRRGPGQPWRNQPMNGYTRLALAAAAVLVAAIGGIYLLGPGRPNGGVGGPGPSAAPTPTRTPEPTLPPNAGTVTLTDSGCSWDQPAVSFFPPAPLQIDVVNETGTFGNFRLYRLAPGYPWEDAIAWAVAANEALQRAENPFGSFPPVVEVGSVDVPEPSRAELTGMADIPGTYGVICSSNEPPPGLVFGVYLVGPLVIE